MHTLIYLSICGVSAERLTGDGGDQAFPGTIFRTLCTNSLKLFGSKASNFAITDLGVDTT